MSGTIPFIARREVLVHTPNVPALWKALPADIQQSQSLSRWSVETIHNYVAMLQAFGFNAIQVADNPQIWAMEDTDPVVWRKNLLEFCRAARDRGMGVSLYVWGNTVYWMKGQDRLCPHNPSDRRVLDTWHDHYAELAPLIDQLVTHWVDPGGANTNCPQCTIRTAQELHNEILQRMRARNPKVRSFFSTWFVTEKTWPGYAGVESLLRGGVLAPDVGIALGLMNGGADGVRLDFAGELKQADLEKITAAGRAAGVWAWYTTDFELIPSLHVHTDLLQNYFRNLPAATRDQLDWHSVEDNYHGWNMPNLYVAARLMQNPALDSRQLLEDFARDYFGPAATPALQAMRALELVRTGSWRYEQQLSDNGAVPVEREANRALSTAWRQQRLAEVRAVQAALAKTAVPSTHRPSFPALLTPSDYLDELSVHLAAAAEMLEFLEAEEGFWNLARQGVAAEKLGKTLSALPVVQASDRHMVHMERRAYEQRLARISKFCEKQL